MILVAMVSSASGGRADYRVYAQTEAQEESISVRIVEGSDGGNKVEVYDATGTSETVLQTFEFSNDEVADYSAGLAPFATGFESAVLNLETKLETEFTSVADLNEKLRQDIEASNPMGPRTTVVARGYIDDEDLNFRNVSTDRLINVSDIEVSLQSTDRNWLESFEIGVDLENKVFYSVDSNVVDDSIDGARVVWTRWNDWRANGTSKEDVFDVDNFLGPDPQGLIIDPYEYGLSIGERWGQIDLGAGDDLVDLRTAVDIDGPEILDAQGNDTYIGVGGEGWTNLNYANATGPINADAEAGVVVHTNGEVDIVENISHYRLSDGNDVFRASFNDRSDVTGMEGDDTFIGSGDIRWDKVRYDDEHYDANLSETAGIVLNLSNFDISYVQSRMDGSIDGGILGAKTAQDTFGDVDTFALNGFGETFQNVEGSRYHDDIMIGDEHWNNFRGEGGNDYIDGGVGGGGVEYLWDHDRDAREWNGQPELITRGIRANLSDYDVNSIKRWDTDKTNETFETLNSNEVIDAYGYTDTVVNMNSLQATSYDDVVFSANLHRPEATWGTNYSDVQLSAGSDLLIGGVVDTMYAVVNYNDAEWVYDSDGHEHVLTDPSGGLNLDLSVNPRQTYTDYGNVDDFVGSVVDTGMESIQYDAAAQYLQAVQAAGDDMSQYFGYRITDPYGDTDFIFNTSHFGGTSFDDRLLGDSFDNQFDGRDGADFISGRSGDDFMRGQRGDDTLIGGDGQDLLRGGQGNDVAIVDLTEYGAGFADPVEFKEMATGDGGYDTLQLVVNRAEWDSGEISLGTTDNWRNGYTQNIEFTGSLAGISVETMFWEFEKLEVYDAADFDEASGTFSSGPILEQNLAESIENAEIAVGGNERDNITANGDTRVVFSQGGNDHIEVSGYHSALTNSELRINTGAGNDTVSVGPDLMGEISIERDQNDVGIDVVDTFRIDLQDVEIVEREVIGFDLATRLVTTDTVYDAVLRMDSGASVVLEEAVSLDADGAVVINEGAIDIINIHAAGQDIQTRDYWAVGNRFSSDALVFNHANAASVFAEDDVDVNISYVEFGNNETNDEVSLDALVPAFTAAEIAFAAAQKANDLIMLENLSDLTAAEIAARQAEIEAEYQAKLGTIEAQTTYFALGGDDTVIGTNYDERIYGGDGNDELIGMGGDDRLYGGRGDDTLHASTGTSYLDGGEGSDDFRVELNVGGMVDISDTAGTNDKLTIELNTPSSLNWAETFAQTSVEDGVLNLVGSGLNVTVDGFGRGSDSIETVEIFDLDDTGNGGDVASSYNLVSGGIVDPASAGDSILIADAANANNPMFGDSDNRQILGFRGDFGTQGGGSFAAMHGDDLIEVSLMDLGGDQYEVSVVNEINEQAVDTAFALASGDRATDQDDGVAAARDSLFVSQSEFTALIESKEAEQAAAEVVGGGTTTVSAEELYSLTSAIMPGGISNSGPTLGMPGVPEVLTVGGAGDDVIFGLDNEINEAVVSGAATDANGAAADFIVANAGNDTIVARGGTNTIIAGEGSDNVYISREAQTTKVYGDKVNYSLEGKGELRSAMNRNSLGERINETDTVHLDFGRTEVNVYEVGTDKWIVERDASGQESLFDVGTPGGFFDEGSLNGNFDMATDSVIELHDIEAIQFNDGKQAEIGSKGTLRVALDYHNDKPIIHLLDNAKKFKIITPARVVTEDVPDVFTVTENTMGGFRNRQVIMAEGTEIDAEPYFDDDPNIGPQR